MPEQPDVSSYAPQRCRNADLCAVVCMAQQQQKICCLMQPRACATLVLQSIV